MKFSDYILLDAIALDVKATDIEGVIREIVQPLLDAGGVEKDEYEKIIKSFLFREELGSTDQGGGVAVPHTTHPGVNRSIGTVAVSTDGIDFGYSPDGEKVYVFFPILAPRDIPGDFLRVVEHLTRRLKDDDTIVETLKQCKTREDVFALLEVADSK
ncbi:MAG: PTS sugar transporter subunit IIA [Planctomycetaceae bacterium]|jgi:PTS system fructose-specific IIA component/PTS system nitrogen regulatory IIA component|nr:PTS sugar transporter subunit IIA [Planctomycetaceae bacterium]